MNSSNYNNETKLLNLEYQIEKLKKEIALTKSLYDTAINGNVTELEFRKVQHTLEKKLIHLSEEYLSTHLTIIKEEEKKKNQNKKIKRLNLDSPDLINQIDMVEFVKGDDGEVLKKAIKDLVRNNTKWNQKHN